MSHPGVGFEAERRQEVSRIYRRAMGLALQGKSGKALVEKGLIHPQMNAAEGNGTALPDMKLAAMLRCRVGHFPGGAVIGSKAFVNEAFAAARGRFAERQKDGARRMKGNGNAATGVLWRARDLRVRSGRIGSHRVFPRSHPIINFGQNRGFRHAECQKQGYWNPLLKMILEIFTKD